MNVRGETDGGSRGAFRGGVQLTQIGLWFVVFSLVVGLAATNTGNNSLYMVLAAMMAAIVVSLGSSWLNLRQLEIEIEPPTEIYARTPASFHYRVSNRSRILPRWLIQMSLDERVRGELIPHVLRRRRHVTTVEGRQAILLRRRGRQDLSWIYLSTLFPFGLFRCSRRCAIREDIVVFPELFHGDLSEREVPGHDGDDSVDRRGLGHDLYALRRLRVGDDPRHIHWKQTARVGELIYQERAADEARRVSVVLDNAVGPLRSAEAESRFERLVSEAATAAIESLQLGFEVELITRDDGVPFGFGVDHRFALLECLALVEVRDAAEAPPLPPSAALLELRYVLGRHGEVEVSSETLPRQGVQRAVGGVGR